MLDRSHLWIHYTTKKDLDDGIRNLCFVNVVCAAAACNILRVIPCTTNFRKINSKISNVHYNKFILNNYTLV